MTMFTTPTREQVEHWTRIVDYGDAAIGAQLSATAGQSPRRLMSLPMATEFLSPIDEVTHENLHDTINFVNPIGLAEWVRDTIGDVALGDALAAIAADGRAFGFQVRDIKPLMVERLTQYAAVMSDGSESEPVTN